MSRWKCFVTSLVFLGLVFMNNTRRDELFKQARLRLLKGLEYPVGTEKEGR